MSGQPHGTRQVECAEHTEQQSIVNNPKLVHEVFTGPRFSNQGLSGRLFMLRSTHSQKRQSGWTASYVTCALCS